MVRPSAGCTTAGAISARGSRTNRRVAEPKEESDLESATAKNNDVKQADAEPDADDQAKWLPEKKLADQGEQDTSSNS